MLLKSVIGILYVINLPEDISMEEGKQTDTRVRPPEKEVQKAENHILYGLIYLCHSNKT